MLHRENKIKTYHYTSASDMLNEVMEHYNISQADLAARIGVSQKNVSDILNRKRYLNEVLALRIQKVMGISGKLLLTLDANYKFKLAEKQHLIRNSDSKSSLFLKRYDWVNA